MGSFEEQISMSADPFSPEDYHSRKLLSAIDALILGADTALLRVSETILDITEEEYHWEPLSDAERLQDIPLSAETKRVWRVFPVNGVYTYDYGERSPGNPAFTTIAWIMNHIAQTAEMYLYCIKTGNAVGEAITWDDLPVYSNLSDMRDYIFRALQDTRDYLAALNGNQAHHELNKLTPAPWGEMRPAYLNLWGGSIEHALQHAMQIAVRKERIRQAF
jgi:hypothetical protein